MNIADEYKTLFPYDEPREKQVDGMETVYRAAEEAGFVSMEGACGTGKTLTALVPYLGYVRSERTSVERVLAITSVKQQMPAFQDEVDRINEQLPSGVRPISGITLVGLPDVHPFIDQGVVTDHPYETIDSLREGARELVSNDAYGYEYTDLVSEAETTSTSGKYAYPSQIPEMAGVQYDPYYARYRAEFDGEDDEDTEAILPFDTDDMGLLRAEDIREICGQVGLCPHSVMRLAIEHVDVVLGNYNHVFEPRTAEQFTAPIIDDDTVAVLDEAHNLVPRVRGFLSEETTVRSLIRARNESREIGLLAELAEYTESTVRASARAGIRGERTAAADDSLSERMKEILTKPATTVDTIDDIEAARSTAEEVLEEAKLSPDVLFEWADFLDAFADRISQLIEDESNLQEEEETIQLRDPEQPSADGLSEWAALSNDATRSDLNNAQTYGAVIAQVQNEITDEGITKKTNANAVGTLLSKWYNKNNVRYYRSIELRERFKITDDLRYEWQDEYKAKLTLHNCIPRDEIAAILDQFHSAVLMSATLEPIDIYKYTTGLSILEENDRQVFERTYGLTFPNENRVTLGVATDKFKYSNRGSAFTYGSPNLNNETREQYEELLLDASVNIDGNVLIVMPSYSEAEWAGEILQRSYDYSADDIYIDESSSNTETQQMKEEFFNSSDSILVTGARGTLIEGVDYLGDRLSGVIVCGVPITDTNSDYKRAIQAAYDELFVNDGTDWDGFTLAFTVPAVRKTRQAIGRVIRTNDDIGARILADERYVNPDAWDSVNNYLSPYEQDELEPIKPDDVPFRLDAFWNMHD